MMLRLSRGGCDLHALRSRDIASAPNCLRQAFDVASEAPRLRDRYGRNTLGQRMLLARRLVESGYHTPALETALARFRTSIEIFREANVPIFSELEELSARYQRITGSMTVEWEGQERPLPQLQPYLKSPDRAVRERAGALRCARDGAKAL